MFRAVGPVEQWCSGPWRSGYTLNLYPQLFLSGPAKDEHHGYKQ